MPLKFVADVNRRAEDLIEEFRTAVQGRLPDTFDEAFYRYRFENPYFGYVEVQNDACAPFYMFSNNDDLVAAHYFWYGKNGYEVASVREWVMRAKKAKVVFDVGAHTGLFSLLASRSNPGLSKVVAFEPTARASSRILENLIVNALVGHVAVETKAISNSEGEVEFMIYVDDYQIGTGSSFVGTGKAYEVRRRERATTTTLDAYIKATGLVPDLLKIDVEGAEELALEGARELLATRKATFLIEVLPETIDGVLAHLGGYKILLIDDHNNATIPFERGRVEHFVNILAVPDQ
ncbi:FkbM family methyltransferase [uncultured Methylobacterium sp.]|jgi:FkbM family methyltransferase|uniref:FkbM family methyltransferase n=1 Tax=uncultured Methylobacterium sp. TaxID=157278 RepID=UPI00262B4D1A|nr:FkbM family methyltransferase [uncultured Methylobacterium sp.]